MKKLIIFFALALTSYISFGQTFKRTVTDEGNYFKITAGIGDTIIVDKSKILYIRQENSKVALVMFGFGGENVRIYVDSAGWKSGSVNQFVEDLNTALANAVKTANLLEMRTYKIANSTFPVTSDSAFVYVSFYTPSTNTGKIYFKGDVGVYIPLEASKSANWGTGTSIINDFTILSNTSVDSVYIVSHK